MIAVVLTPTKVCENCHSTSTERYRFQQTKKDRHKSKNFNYFGDTHILKTRKWVNLTESC